MESSPFLQQMAKLRDAGALSHDRYDRAVAAVAERGEPPPFTGSDDPWSDVRATIGSYVLLEHIGDGGMGVVCRARHRVGMMASRQGGDVAIKLLHAHLCSQAALVSRFRREAEALGALDHPNIVKVYDLIEESGRLAIVMEWIPGRTLSDLIGKVTGPIPWERARTLMVPLLQAMEHAHSRDIVHRDLKPDNIRVSTQGVLKVLDFGIARLGQGRGRTKTGTGMGTIDYMAPEQYTSAKDVDQRADIYAIGMTLYEVVAGRLPWDPEKVSEYEVLHIKHTGKLPPPTAFYPDIPPWVVEAIMLATAPDPTQRLESAQQLRQALRLADGATKQAVPTRRVPLQEAPEKRVTPDMAIMDCLFTFRGRMNRSDYFFKYFILWEIPSIIFISFVLIGVDSLTQPPADPAVAGLFLFFFGSSLIKFYVALAAGIKRGRDIGSPAWLTVIGLLFPYINVIMFLLLWLSPSSYSTLRPPPNGS